MVRCIPGIVRQTSASPPANALDTIVAGPFSRAGPILTRERIPRTRELEFRRGDRIGRTLMCRRMMNSAHESEIEMDGRGSHDDRHAEDESHQDYAGKCRLEKLHEAFHVSCTI